MVGGEGGAGAGGPGEFLGLGEAFLAEGGGEVGILKDAADAFGDGARVVGVNEDGGVACDFGDGGGGGGDDGTAAGHGFEDGEAKAFVEGGIDGDGGVLVEVDEVGFGDVAGEVDLVLEAVGADGGEDVVGHPGDLADDFEAVGEGGGLAEVDEGLEEADEVFAWVEVADVEDVGGRWGAVVGWWVGSSQRGGERRG